MASSSSSTPVITQHPSAIRKVNDSLFELYRPAKGSIDIEIVFFHGFQAQDDREAYLKAWMREGDSECWLNTWLADEFPQARVLSVSYDSSVQVSDSAGRMDMYLVGETIAQSLIGLKSLGQNCPVMLVGHSIGGLVLKQVCGHAEKIASNEDLGSYPYKMFLVNMKGAFFFSTAHSGSRIEPSSSERGPLLQYWDLLSKYAARLTSDFATLRRRYGWKTYGVLEANETHHSRSILPMTLPSFPSVKRPRHSLMVEEGSARPDMDDFLMLSGEDNYTICRPKERSSSSFQFLVRSIREVLENEEWMTQEWRSTLQGPAVTDMSERLDSVIQMLRLGEAEPSRVALVGMGGIGKTTLAKQVLLRVAAQFEFCCLVEDVKTTLKQNMGSTKLQNLVAQNIYKGTGHKVHLREGDMRSQFSKRKVFMILDDVESEEQIKDLLALFSSNRLQLQRGSRLMITSRNRNPRYMPTFTMWDVPFLTDEEAETVFLAQLDRNSFQNISKEVMKKVVLKCEGLPLTIQVIGSYLRFEKNEATWTSALEKLTKAESLNGSVEDRLWDKLGVSFDELAPLERGMFLDLAVFDERTAYSEQYSFQTWETVWKGDPATISGLQNLIDRSFVLQKSIWSTLQDTEVEVLWIHEQLRALGQRKSFSGLSNQQIRGLWRQDDILNFLNEYKGTEAQIEVISVGAYETITTFTLQREYQWNSFSNLPRLRLLRLSHVSMIGNEAHRFPNRLVFLHLISCFESQNHGFHFLESDNSAWPIRDEDVGGLQQLRVLHLDNCSSICLPSNFHRLAKLHTLMMCGGSLAFSTGCGVPCSLEMLILKSVQISYLPYSFFQLSNIQTLSFESSPNMKILQGSTFDLDPWRGTTSLPFNNLKDLRLEDLPDLVELPQSLGMLVSLERLVILRCPTFRKLPNCLEKLRSLITLELVGLDIRELPDTIGHLIALEKLIIWPYRTPILEYLLNPRALNLDGCSVLQSLPDTLGKLQHLRFLHLPGCFGLQSLPDTLGQFRCLESLELQGWSGLQNLPVTLGQLECLESLDLRGCSGLQSLPDILGRLEHLKYLLLEACSGLQSLPDTLGQLKRLQYLNLGRCSGLQSLPDTLGQLERLKSLLLQECSSLKSLPDTLGQLECLSSLNLEGCSGLQSLPDTLGQLEHLRSLQLDGCSSLQSLPETLGQLERLESLDLSRCSGLQSLPDTLGQLERLEYLDLEGCSGLQSLPDTLGQLDCLKRLDLRGCSGLQSLLDTLGQLERLNTLYLEGCSGLQSLPDTLGQLECLSSLNLKGCSGLQSLPDTLGQWEHLRSLQLDGCSSLQSLPDTLGQLERLESLDLSRCSGLQSLPDTLGQFVHLSFLHLEGYSGLQSLPDTLGQLERLKSLYLRGSSGLQSLPDTLGQLERLECLDLRGCSGLMSLPDTLGQLECLNALYLEGCSGLQGLPDTLGQLECLNYLELKGCSGLRDLPDTLGQLERLTYLDLEGCSGLQSLPDTLGQLEHLEYLHLRGCCGLQSLPDSLGQVERLKYLHLGGCSGLQSLPDTLGQLERLKYLNLEGCSGLQSLPDTLGQLECVKHLNLV